MGYIRLNSEDKLSTLPNHVHEVRGNVKLGNENHYHEIYCITGKVIQVNDKEHVHEIYFRTSSKKGHYHEFKGFTLGQVEIGENHIHYVQDMTTSANQHNHEFLLVTDVNKTTI